MSGREQHWVDGELPDELRRVLRHARGGEAEHAQVARLRERLGVALGPAFASPAQLGAEPRARGAGGPATPAPTPALVLAKIIAPLCVFALGFGAMWWARGGSLPPSAAGGIRSVPLAALQSQVLVVPAAAPAQPPAFPPPSAASVSRPPSAASANPPPSAAGKRSPLATKARRAPEHELGLSEELRQLQDIRAALERSPQRALTAADAHQRRFPHGALGPERELLRIDAWLRLGEYERARQRAQQLLSEPNAHPYRAQITQLLAHYRSAEPSARGVQ